MRGMENRLAEITTSLMAGSVEFRGHDGSAERRHERQIGGLGGAVPDAADLAGASL